VRRAVLARLKSDAGLTALVSAASVHPVAVVGVAGSAEPAWPFIKLGALGTLRLRAAGVNGGRVTVDVHAFAKSRYNQAGAMIETAEDHASRIGAAIETALADQHLDLEGGADAHISLNDIRLLQDDEPDAFHWFAQLTARVLAA
jgi:hypothetical protein